MAIDIKMPQLSDTMNSGKILSWKKKVGDTIARGDILAEVETDKANLEIESFNPGVLLKVVMPAGEVAKVGDIIAIIGNAGESVSNGQKAAAPVAVAPQAPKPQQAQPSSPAPVVAQASAPARNTEEEESSGRIKASPLAKKLAEQRNIDLSTVRGSGPNGRIVKKDLEGAAEAVEAQAQTPATPPSYSAQTTTAAAPAMRATAPVSATPGYVAKASEPRTVSVTGGRLTPYSKMRETIARRMQQSIAETPHFYVTAAINMAEVVKLREILKEQPEYKGLSINHFIIKASAYALARERRVNRAVRDNQVYEPDQINIGIITAIDDGLLIPVIHETDKLNLKDLVFESKSAVERARAGRPNSTDLSGGTFSISNLGMFDVDSFTAIINPGQGAVLAVSSVSNEPVISNGQVVAGKVMRVTLGVDHRVIDGVMCGNWLKHFKQALEVPALLMV